MNTPIFITGADGFIGSQLVCNLVNRGFAVKALSQYNSFGHFGWLGSLPRTIMAEVEVVSGDVRDKELMLSCVSGCEVVLHLASLIGIPFSYVAPRSYLETNTIGTLNLLQSALETGVSRFIHTSTSEVYGSAVSVPISESHRVLGQSPYAASKIAADQLAYSFFASYGLPVLTLRPFNTYGPRQSLRAVIPSIIYQLKQGAQVRLGKTDTTRDFNFVTDTVGGFEAALTADNSCLGEVFNLGTGYEISIQEVAKLIADIMGKELQICTAAERLRPPASEVERLCSDSSKALNKLGWAPEFSGEEGLRNGLIKTIEWFCDSSNLEFYNRSDFVV